MEKLFIDKTDTTAFVLFDPQSGRYEISGRSFPENPVEFYKSMFDWIDCFVPEIDDPIVLRIELDYFNSASNRMILLLLKRLEEHFKQGKDVKIQWCYDDEELLGDGQMYSTIVGLPFELIEIN